MRSSFRDVIGLAIDPVEDDVLALSGERGGVGGFTCDVFSLSTGDSVVSEAVSSVNVAGGSDLGPSLEKGRLRVDEGGLGFDLARASASSTDLMRS
jgi:hypothetical protein